MSEFERIINDSMADYNDWMDEDIYIDLEEDTDWDVYGEEEFA